MLKALFKKSAFNTALLPTEHAKGVRIACGSVMDVKSQVAASWRRAYASCQLMEYLSWLALNVEPELEGFPHNKSLGVDLFFHELPDLCQGDWH